MVNGIIFKGNDHLGSARVMTDSSGAASARTDLYPYGEVWSLEENASHETIFTFHLDRYGADVGHVVVDVIGGTFFGLCLDAAWR